MIECLKCVTAAAAAAIRIGQFIYICIHTWFLCMLLERTEILFML